MPAAIVAAFLEGTLSSGSHSIAPAIGKLLHVPAGQLNLSLVAQLATAMVLLPVIGKLGDIHGHRRVLRIALLATVAGTILCFAAVNFPMYLAGKALEGGAIAYSPLMFGIVRDRLPVRTANRTIAATVGGLAAGALLGDLLASLIFGLTGDVRIVLLIPVIFFILTVVTLYVFVPETVNRAPAKIDWPGAVLFVVVLILLLVLSTGLTKLSWFALALLAVIAALTAVWIRIEVRRETPFVDVRLLHGRHAAFYVIGFGMGWAAGGMGVNFSNFMSTAPRHGYGFSMSVSTIALISAASAGAAAVGALLVARLIKRTGAYRIVGTTGFAVVALGFLGVMVLSSSAAMMVFGYVAVILGLALAQASLPVLVSARAPQPAVGVAIALFSTTRNLASTIAAALFSTLLSAFVLSGATVPGKTGYLILWGSCAAFAVLSMAVTYFVRDTGSERSPAPAASSAASSSEATLH